MRLKKKTNEIETEGLHSILNKRRGRWHYELSFPLSENCCALLYAYLVFLLAIYNAWLLAN